MKQPHQKRTQKAIAPNQPQAKIVRPSLHPIEELQNAIGNREVNRLLASQAMPSQPKSPAKPLFRGLSRELILQPKLMIGAAEDKYEQEADRVAQQVVNQLDAPQTLQREEELDSAEGVKPVISTLQRSPLTPQDKEDEDTIQSKTSLQRGEAIAGGEASADLTSAINQARGGGQAIADNIRKPMEQAFGADFSGVKVHTDGHSDQLNRSIQARAFTTRQDVFFRQGEYNPGSRGGQELLAHELTHVVQQSRGAVQRSQQTSTSLPLTAPTAATENFLIGMSVIQRSLEGVEVKVGDKIKKDDKEVYQITKIDGISVEAKNIDSDAIIEFTIGSWEDDYFKINTVDGGHKKKLSEDIGSGVDKVPQVPESKKEEADAPLVEQENSKPETKKKKKKPETKEKKKESRNKPSDIYPSMAEFTYDLPNNLGTLEWVDDPQYVTENGWMSKNINFSDKQSKEDLGGNGLISAHAIIAIKKPNSGLIRINPHFTLRDQERQKDRQDAEAKRRTEKKGHQTPKKTTQEREAEAEDALYSKQKGMKSEREEKEGQKSLLKTKPFNELPFTDEWVKGIAEAAIKEAQKKKLNYFYEIGTINKKF